VSPKVGSNTKKSNGSPQTKASSIYLQGGGRSPPKMSTKSSKLVAVSPVKRNLNLVTQMGNTNNTRTVMGGAGGKMSSQMASGFSLTTPTSISMINSFIIKNADSSFD
jgi:hypothetical protein